jgi:uncharacterized protein (TIGR02246 family)
MNIISVFLLSAAAILSQTAAVPSRTDPAAEIRAVLDTMEKTWNSGDLDTYISAYDATAEVTMQSPSRRYRGFATIRSLFVDTFASAEKRGHLHFTEVEITVLDPASAMAIGRFNIDFPSGKERHGYYTVLFRRRAEGWKIVHDQS